MPIIFDEHEARFDDVCKVEEAELLLAWCLEHPQGKADFSTCRHLHTAILQTLMVARTPCKALPDDPFLQSLILSACPLHSSKELQS